MTKLISLHLCKNKYRLDTKSSKECPNFFKKENIHKNLNKLLHHVQKYGHHTSLECGKSIANAKRYPSTCKGAYGQVNVVYFLSPTPSIITI